MKKTSPFAASFMLLAAFAFSGCFDLNPGCDEGEACVTAHIDISALSKEQLAEVASVGIVTKNVTMRRQGELFWKVDDKDVLTHDRGLDLDSFDYPRDYQVTVQIYRKGGASHSGASLKNFGLNQAARLISTSCSVASLQVREIV